MRWVLVAEWCENLSKTNGRDRAAKQQRHHTRIRDAHNGALFPLVLTSGGRGSYLKHIQADSINAIVAKLNDNGVPSTQIPAKIEGLAFGPDVVLDGTTTHTLYLGNDNDFVPAVAGPNRWYVFGFTDDYLASLNCPTLRRRSRVSLARRTVTGGPFPRWRNSTAA